MWVSEANKRNKRPRRIVLIFKTQLLGSTGRLGTMQNNIITTRHRLTHVHAYADTALVSGRRVKRNNI